MKWWFGRVFREIAEESNHSAILDLKRAAGCNTDNNEIATRFRRFLTDRGIKRDAANVEKLFSDFGAKVGRI
ncbi:hypothetical protein [Paracoccus lutimaris]|uniref:Uncharacterized protein n=1 Tax=Paracoccus lutimaris TaxID=1490030 RepID=A0A368YE50_9RHOB|nr:hypothetical protein [Paracoccus lutimaris]RCW77959.1 hypothetical protein DFP89_1517 [Paracoccus lutimaris]